MSRFILSFLNFSLALGAAVDAYGQLNHPKVILSQLRLFHD
jgi:hypothetical protein